MIMQDKLLLLHRFLNEIKNIQSSDELSALSESYKSIARLCTEDDILYQLWQDAKSLGNEMLFLKHSGADAARSKRLAALTAEERAELEETENVIDKNRFRYHFQPIVNAANGEIYSYEALMRPQSDMNLTPFHIIKYAELTGRQNDIERATFLNILELIDSNKEVFKDKRVFINSIPKTKLLGDDFRRVAELLMTHSDTAVIELTEQAEPDDEELNAIKERYQNMDIKIAIDDYGTGYSNVKNLLRYMPNYVKIDRSLLSDIQNNPKKRHFVREIIEFCHDNGIMALAEGVESSEELRAVILLGVDLVQGFYTSRPNAEVIDSIPYDISQEIKLYQQERQDGKGHQVYAAESSERVLLDRLVKDDISCILIGKKCSESQVAVVGSPALNTDIHIEVAKDHRCKIILENAHLSNVKNRPCIDLGENSDVTLVLNGENKLDKSGIRVPESARLTVEGEGNLTVNVNSAEFFGIGNDNSSRHGNIVFNQSGTISVFTSGQTGVCIGSGQGGSIKIDQGMFVLNLDGDTGVAIGSLYSSSKLEIITSNISADVSLAKGVAIGSLCGDADVYITRSSAKLYLGGSELVAIGTFSGDLADVLIKDAIIAINIRANRCVGVGALDKTSVLRIESAAYNVTAGGVEALPFGGFSHDTKVSLIHADTSIIMDTEAEMDKYLSSIDIEVVGGRHSFTEQDNEIDLQTYSNA